MRSENTFCVNQVNEKSRGNYLSGLQFGAVVATDIDRILAGKVMRSQFLVEQESIGTEFLLCNAVLALDVSVALARNGISSVHIRTIGRSLLRSRELIRILLVLLLLPELRLGSKVVVGKLASSWGFYKEIYFMVIIMNKTARRWITLN